MDDLRELFKKSGLTLNELSKLSGVSVSTAYRYIHHKTKEMDTDYYASLYEILKEYKSCESKHDDKNIRKNMDYAILLAERNMYKLFYDQIKEFYTMYHHYE